MTAGNATQWPPEVVDRLAQHLLAEHTEYPVGWDELNQDDRASLMCDASDLLNKIFPGAHIEIDAEVRFDEHRVWTLPTREAAVRAAEALATKKETPTVHTRALIRLVEPAVR